MKKIVILTFFVVCLFGNLVFSETVPEKSFAIGLGYPYLSVKHTILKKLAIEGRFATGKDIDAYSIRNYYNWLFFKQEKVYSGLEFGYFTFRNKNELSGNGFFQMFFTGMEFYIKPNLSCALDTGITLISANSEFQNDKLESSGLEWVLNIGIYYYFL